MARAVAPLFPHHITQRGNRRQKTFFCPDDYVRYLNLMAEWCTRSGVEVWAYCLMPNHAHLVAVPDSEDGLRRAIGEAHRRYTLAVNQREGWTGHLWQGRFSSFPMDARYTLAAARYVELNPVRAGLVEDAAAYPWSSARAHLLGRDDRLVKVAPLLDRIGDWRRFLGTEVTEAEDLRAHESTGRPLGDDVFVDDLEITLGRPLRPQQTGRKPKCRDTILISSAGSLPDP
jgi:putative transposase